MVAASPASPPPTTMILGTDAMISIQFQNSFYRTLSDCCETGGSCAGVSLHCGRKNAAVVAMPTPINISAITMHTLPNHLREVSLTVIPHLAQNRYRPKKKCHDAAMIPIT